MGKVLDEEGGFSLLGVNVYFEENLIVGIVIDIDGNFSLISVFIGL